MTTVVAMWMLLSCAGKRQMNGLNYAIAHAYRNEQHCMVETDSLSLSTVLARNSGKA
jgi:hypothetical protein